MSREKLDAIWKKTYPADVDAREEAALADLMAAREQGEETKRPSVETLMHGFFPQAYVVHTHPSLANGITCARDGEAWVSRLFPDRAVWIGIVNPGYTLAHTIRTAVLAFRERVGKYPSVVFLENHGIVIAGESVAEIDATTRDVCTRIRTAVRRYPDFSPCMADGSLAAKISGRIAELGGEGSSTVLFETNTEIMGFVRDVAHFEPLSSSFTPDHIVYCGHEPLFLDAAASGVAIHSGPESLDAVFIALAKGWAEYVKRNGAAPRIIAVCGLGYFACAKNAKAASAARDLVLDTTRVAVYAESFGGRKFMTSDKISFIRNWEVEKYRAKEST
jgi:rhamnose utilization protein RhaD (predicted bifunctional aldolase and dehydrogenase)